MTAGARPTSPPSLSPAARALLAQRAAQRSPAGRFPARAAGAAAPASFSQRRFWLFEQLYPDTGVYQNELRLELGDAVDVPLLERAISLVVERHEVLRSRLVTCSGERVLELQTLPPAPVTLTPVDLDALAAACSRPFDLAAEPPLRLYIASTPTGARIVSLLFHHSAADAWGRAVFVRELDAAYGALAAGREPDLPPLPIQFADFAAWEQRRAEGVSEAALVHWRSMLADVDLALALPADRPRPESVARRAERVGVRLERELVTKLRVLAADEGATLFMVLLAGLQTLVARWSRQDRFLVAAPIAGRTEVETEPLVGCFINTLALRADLSGAPSFREVVRRVRQATAGAYAHQALPFDQVVQLLQPGRDGGAAAHPQVLFNFRSHPPIPTHLDALDATVAAVPIARTLFDFDLELTESGQSLEGTLAYDAEAFAAVTASRFIEQWIRMLDAAVASPDGSALALPMMSAAERECLLVEWNGVEGPWPDSVGVHDLIAQRAAGAPETEAVVSEEGSLTRAELQHRARTLAARLRELGVGPGARVGLCVERRLETVVAMVAVLEAGGAYVPLDPELPAQRIAFMCEDAGIGLVITRASLRTRLPADLPTFELDGWTPAPDAPLLERDADPERAGRIAYVIYTSGSTGRPKGVAISHRSLANLCFAMPLAYEIGPDDRFLQFCALSFDISVQEIFGALVIGSTLVLRTEAMGRSPEEFVEGCARFGVTVLDLPTAFWHELTFALAAGRATLPPSVRITLMGGERALPEAVAAWQRLLAPRVLLVNGYGPTENTVSAVAYKVPSLWGDADDLRRPVPIGRPIRNVRGYVLDARQQPVPIGVPGELWIGGAGVALGYLNRPELTADRFRPDPFAAERGVTGARMYRSGDLVRWRPDGMMEFLGRTDEQIKLRGYRIELGEIETAVGGCDGVAEAIAVVRDDGAGPRLVAYWTATESAQDGAPAAQSDALRERLRAQLPPYMVPALVRLDALPRTSNGKIDRAALPAAVAGGTGPSRPPRSPLEVQLARAWEALLPGRAVGMRDDFFELGGHSLLAARVMIEVERVTGLRLPASALVETRTIEGLAHRIADTARDGVSPSALTVVQRGGSRRPVFFLHGDSTGAGVYCIAVARALGEDLPFYSIAPHDPDEAAAPRTIEAMAEELLPLIRAAQPRGPYRLGGFCNGGLVAFELARRLRGLGERVELLLIVDAGARNAGLRHTSRMLRAVAQRLGGDEDTALERAAGWLRTLQAQRARLRVLRRAPWSDRRTGARRVLRRTLRRLVRGASEGEVAPAELTWDESLVPWRGRLDYIARAMASYVPPRYDGRIDLLWAQADADPCAEPVLGWHHVSRDVVVEIAPVHHQAVVTTHLPELLRRRLAELDG